MSPLAPGPPRNPSSDHARTRAAAPAKIDPHRARHANPALKRKTGGSVLALAFAMRRKNMTVSADHLPPTSPARTTSRALECGPTSSGYVRSLRRLAAWKATPSVPLLRVEPFRCGGEHTPTSCRSPTACSQRLEGLRPQLPIFCHQTFAVEQASPNSGP